MLNLKSISTWAIAVTSATLGAVAMQASPANAQYYNFTVTNYTTSSIVQLWGSEDGSNWLEFSLYGPVRPGETVQIDWAEWTNDTNCVWYVQAVNSDGTVSEVAPFDFCENPSLVLE